LVGQRERFSNRRLLRLFRAYSFLLEPKIDGFANKPISAFPVKANITQCLA